MKYYLTLLSSHLYDIRMEQQAVIPPIEEKRTSILKTVLFSSLGIFLAVGLLSFGFFLGSNQTTPSQPLQTQKNYISTRPEPSILPAITKNTVSMAIKNNILYLRYQDTLFQEGPTGSAVTTENISQEMFSWSKLVDVPVIMSTGQNDILSIKKLSNNNILFVVRSNKPAGWKLNVFYYEAINNKISNPFSFDWPNDKEKPVPIVGQVSPDEKYVSFNMHGCWNCGGGIPDTMVVNLGTFTSKRIGQTQYFAWKENGEYEYKEFKTIPCELEGPGICPYDTSVPLQTGNI
jgi:hypothetical protein